MRLKRIIVLAGLLAAISTNVFAATFTDMTAEHWGYEYVIPLADANIINGYPDGTFLPEATISKGEFMKLVIQSSLPAGVDINDAPSSLDHWAGKYLYVAETYRIVNPGDLTLETIEQPITRREMVLMITKADLVLRRNALEQDVSVTYNDYDDMDTQEIRYLTHAVSKGLIKGYPDNTFRPDNNMTRAEAATMIYRYNGMEGETAK